MKPDPRTLGCDCINCPLSKEGAPCSPITGEGPENPLGILVGEAPSYEDVAAGRFLVGSVGVQLGEVLSQAGLLRDQLFLIPALACRITAEVGKDKKRIRQAIECCRPGLLEQLKRFDKETPVLAMGQLAQVALMGKRISIGDGRGFIRWGWSIPYEVGNEAEREVVESEAGDDDESSEGSG